MRVLRVPPEQAGTRVDVFVHSNLRNTSRTRAKAIVRNSAYSADGRRLKPSDRLRAEDRVVLWRPPFEEEMASVELGVLYEDAHLVVVDKPPLIAVHPTARYYHSTVLKRLEAQRPGEFLSLVHRLDRETSGVLLLARSPEADRAFKMMFEDRSLAETGAAGARRRPNQGSRPVEKIYLAVTAGIPAEGMIDQPLEIDPRSPLRVKMRIARKNTGLEARTRVSVVERRAGHALVSCQIYTGRQHQIRVHLASVGCPVVGDKLYGPDDRLLARASDGQLTERDLALLELPRHALHAHKYSMCHAVTGTSLELLSPLAPDLAAYWHSLPQ